MAFGPGRLATLCIALTVIVLGADKAGWVRDKPRPPPPAAAAPVKAAAPVPVAQASRAGVPPPGYVRDSADVPANLPDGPDREEIFWFCTACHSSDLIRRQGMSRERWDELLTWMTDRHGMAPLEGADRDRYLEYLAQALPPRRQRGFTNPFLNQQ